MARFTEEKVRERMKPSIGLDPGGGFYAAQL